MEQEDQQPVDGKHIVKLCNKDLLFINLGSTLEGMDKIP